MAVVAGIHVQQQQHQLQEGWTALLVLVQAWSWKKHANTYNCIDHFIRLQVEGSEVNSLIGIRNRVSLSVMRRAGALKLSIASWLDKHGVMRHCVDNTALRVVQ